MIVTDKQARPWALYAGKGYNMESEYIHITLTKEQTNQLIFILFHDSEFEGDETASALYFAIDNQITAQTITKEEDF